MLNHRANTLFVASGSDVAFAVGYKIVVYPVGAVAVSSASNDITVRSGHSFRASDIGVVGVDLSTAFRQQGTPPDATSLIHLSGAVTLSANDKIINLGNDTVTAGVPAYAASPVKIYKDAQGVTLHTNTLADALIADSEGNYDYYHKGDGLMWEAIFDTSNTLVRVIAGHGGQPRFNVCDFGAAGDGSTVDGPAIAATVLAAGTAGGNVFFPGYSFKTTAATAVSVPTGVTIQGSGIKTILGATSPTDAVFDIVGASDVCIRDLTVSHASSDANAPCIDISGASDNVLISNVNFTGGYSAVVVRQGTDIKIRDCKISGAHGHPIYVGDYDDPPNGGFAEQVTISGCDITSTSTSADGISMIFNARDVSIVNNVIHGCKGDGISFTVSGDRVLIDGNQIIGNTLNGITVLADETAFPPATYGQSRNCVISNNTIQSNVYGVHLNHSNAGEIGYGYVVSNNFIKGNTREGILCTAPGAVISGNLITGNGTSASFTSSGILVFGDTTLVENCVISGNQIYNNGETTKTNAGITLNDTDSVTVIGNTVDNLTTIDGNAFTNDFMSISNSTNLSVIGNVCGAGLLDYGTPTSNFATSVGTNSWRSFGNAGIADFEKVVTFADLDATPSVKNGFALFSTANTGATTITTLDDGREGQTVRILINDANTGVTFASSATLKGHAGVDITAGATVPGTIITATYLGTVWHCLVDTPA